MLQWKLNRGRVKIPSTHRGHTKAPLPVQRKAAVCVELFGVFLLCLQTEGKW